MMPIFDIITYSVIFIAITWLICIFFISLKKSEPIIIDNDVDTDNWIYPEKNFCDIHMT